MRDVFDSISREFEYNFFNLRVYEDYPYLQPGNLSSIIDEADVILDYHFSKPIPSYFINAEDWYSSDRRVRRFNKQQRECQSLASYYQGSYRIIHLIRDPRDALVSGVLYHMQNPEDESWLREIRVGDELFNSTSSSSYVQSIRRLKNPVDALAAELKLPTTSFEQVFSGARLRNRHSRDERSLRIIFRQIRRYFALLRFS